MDRASLGSFDCPSLEICSPFMASEAHTAMEPTAYEVWPAWLWHGCQQVVQGTQLAPPRGGRDPGPPRLL